jgi:hypothetical protein
VAKAIARIIAKIQRIKAAHFSSVISISFL